MRTKKNNFQKALFVTCLTLVAVSGTHSEPRISNQQGKEASVYHSKGLEYFYAKEYNAAIEMWKKEIEAGPKNPSWPYFDIGLCYTNLKKYQDAIPYYKKALELGFPADRVYSQLAHAYYNDGKINDAEQNLIEALKLNPSNEKIISDIEYYKESGTVFPNITPGLIQKLKEEYQKKREERTQKIKEIEEQTKRAPREPFYITYFKEILLTLLVFALISFFYFKPWYSYYLYAGNRHLKAQQYELSAQYYEKLFALRNGKNVPYDKLKRVYLKLGRKDEKAIQVFEKIYKENPEDREVISALANAYAEEARNTS